MKGCSGRDHRGSCKSNISTITTMQSMSITTQVVSSSLHGEAYSLQHYMIKFVLIFQLKITQSTADFQLKTIQSNADFQFKVIQSNAKKICLKLNM